MVVFKMSKKYCDKMKTIAGYTSLTEHLQSLQIIFKLSAVIFKFSEAAL